MARNYKRDRKGRFARVNSLTGSKVSKGSSAAPKEFKRNAAFVPKARASLHSQSVGFDTGVNISQKYRISAGSYVRIEHRGRRKVEKAIRKRDDAFVSKLARKVTTNEIAQPLVEKGIRKGRQKIINSLIGGQRKVGGTNAYARLTTSQTGMPTISVRKGKAKTNTKNRRAAIDDYNARMATALRGRRASVSRPQRRVKATQMSGRKVA